MLRAHFPHKVHQSFTCLGTSHSPSALHRRITLSMKAFPIAETRERVAQIDCRGVSVRSMRGSWGKEADYALD